MKAQSLSLTRRGILWFHWGLEASAGLILINLLLAVFMMMGARWMAIPLSYYGRIALFLAPLAQAVMICGVIMTTAAPRESRATRWALLTLLAGIVASAFTIALYSFRWPLQWAIATWPLLFIQGLLMTRYLALISSWILTTERLDIAETKERQSSEDLKDVKKWSNIRSRFDGLLRGGVMFLIVASLFALSIRFFSGALFRNFGFRFFFVSTAIASLVAVLWAAFLLMRFSRSVYDMKSAFGDSTDRPADADARWDHIAPDRMKPLGIALGALAIVAIGGDLWSKHYLLPEYVQERMAEFRNRSTGRQSTSAAIGKPAPEMAMKTIDGDSIILSEQRGRPVLLNFWATWCGPCVAEIPDLVRLAEESDTDGLMVIGISNEPAKTLKPFVQKNGINYPIVSGRGWDAPFDKISAVPTSFLIDREGVIRSVFVGSRSYDDFKAAVVEAIRTPAENSETTSDDAETETLTLRLRPRQEVMGSLVNHYRPIRLELSKQPEEELIAEPSYRSEQPEYGTMQLGDGMDTRITLVIDEVEGEEPRIYIDRNNDEDLTNDGPAEWSRTSGSTLGLDNAVIDVEYSTGPMPYSFAFYRFKERLRDVVLYYRDSARVGELSWQGKNYQVAILEENSDGRFDDLDAGALIIDLNQDGKLVGSSDSPEYHKLAGPFNVHGTVWEVTSLSADGTELKLRRSDKSVEMKPYLDPGNPAPTFTGKDLDGEVVDLASTASQSQYVLLDFWASWCGPCQQEYPHLRRIHARHQDHGLQIIGVTLDSDQEKAVDAAEENHLNYVHVFDGGGWQNAVAQQYRVRSIPTTYLLDQDLKIVAKGLRGDALEAKMRELLGPGDERAVDALEEELGNESPSDTAVRRLQYAKALAKAEEFDRAVVEYGKVLELMPMASASFHLARTYQAIGEFDKSRESFHSTLDMIEETVGDDPLQSFPSLDGTRLTSAIVHLALTTLEHKAGDADAEQEAWQELANLLESSPTPDSSVHWGYLGQALYRVGRTKDSRQALEKGIELRGDKEPTIQLGPRWWYLTMALAQLGETEKATQYYKTLTKQLGPNATETQKRFQAEAAQLLELEESSAAPEA